jgi:hypothetical protein
MHRAGLSPPSIVPRGSPSRGARSALSPLARHVLNSPTGGGSSGNDRDEIEVFSLDMPLDKEPQAPAAAPIAERKDFCGRDFRVVPFVVHGPAMEMLKRKCGEGTAYHTLTFLFFLMALSRGLGAELSGVVRMRAITDLSPAAD